LDEDDELVDIFLTDGSKDVVIVTAGGQAIRFNEESVRAMGRAARGVIGIRLDDDDYVVGMDVVRRDGFLLVVTREGFGKRTPLAEYRRTGRGGKGVRTLQITDRNGPIVDILVVREDEEVMAISHAGILIRIPVSGISVQGRATQGVRLMRLDEGDHVRAIAHLAGGKDEEDREDEGPQNNKLF